MNTLANNLLSFITQIQALGFHPYPAEVITWVTRGRHHGETITVELSGKSVDVRNHGGSGVHVAMFPLNYPIANILENIKKRLAPTPFKDILPFANIPPLSASEREQAVEIEKGCSKQIS